ncbi:hypothetical protein DPMN_143395 [Dreissena polymorpha]|uniref:Uncharacterized protein n=1 Tax=Dreissena polymorpha TaxID=45954 RepID=A0A9D4JLN2_DREPO|nr:hypothetical protein DPMN_143395 [Dreissena polymorpha]
MGPIGIRNRDNTDNDITQNATYDLNQQFAIVMHNLRGDRIRSLNGGGGNIEENLELIRLAKL